MIDIKNLVAAQLKVAAVTTPPVPGMPKAVEPQEPMWKTVSKSLLQGVSPVPLPFAFPKGGQPATPTGGQATAAPKGPAAVNAVPTMGAPLPPAPAASKPAPAQSVGEQPAPVDPNEAYYDAYHKALATQDPEKITAAMTGVADQYTKSNPGATPEAIKKLQDDVYRQGAMRHFKDTNPARGRLLTDDMIQAVAPDAMSKKVQEEALKFKQTNEQVAAKVKNGGFMDWIKANPEALMIPAGLIAMVFGGKPGLVLGAMAAAYGSKGLYDRYKTLTSPEYAKVSASVMKQIQAKPELMEQLDLNNPTALFPQLKGYETPFRDQMALTSNLPSLVNNQINANAATQAQGMMGGAASPEFMANLNKQLAAQNEAAAATAANAQAVR